MSTETERYYDKRAQEYDRVYTKPERADDIAGLSSLIVDALASRRVLELAAGTGFWTKGYADHAAKVTATDLNPSTLDVARARRTWPSTTSFLEADAFDLAAVDGRFDAVFAGFLWSHVPLDRLDALLDEIRSRLEPGSLVALADNNYVHGSNHPVARTDEGGNTYQRRALLDGSEWEVLKNFPTTHELERRLSRIGDRPRVHSLEYFWFATVTAC